MVRLKTFFLNTATEYKKIANRVSGVALILVIIGGSSMTTHWFMQNSLKEALLKSEQQHAQEISNLRRAYNHTVLPAVQAAADTATEAAITANSAAQAIKNLKTVPPIVVRPEKVPEDVRTQINKKIDETNKKLEGAK